MEEKLLKEIIKRLDRLEGIENELKEVKKSIKSLETDTSDIKLILERGVLEDVKHLEKGIEILEAKAG